MSFRLVHVGNITIRRIVDALIPDRLSKYTAVRPEFFPRTKNIDEPMITVCREIKTQRTTVGIFLDATEDHLLGLESALSIPVVITEDGEALSVPLYVYPYFRKDNKMLYAIRPRRDRYLISAELKDQPVSEERAKQWRDEGEEVLFGG